ncbi:rab-GTPase-TBC domain-containing protein [Choanephora cucurbitarum]|nr:rab-GTPase-TBC domain-containing protein [Choanephora cucurbitarum]
MESAYKERLKYFRSVLSVEDVGQDTSGEKWTPVIDMKSFREACFQGIPDEPGLRSLAWKVLMGYLPPDKRMWASTLKTQRLNYYNWVRDLLEEPGEEPPSSDHPLSTEPGSKWAVWFQDNSILEQIDKDVRRTLPDFAFFQLHVPANPLNPLSPPPAAPSILEEDFNESDPLSAATILEEGQPEKEPKTRRFSFGLMGRPRSSSAASRKSLKLMNNTSNASVSISPAHNPLTTSVATSVSASNGHAISKRARSNSRSSVRSFSSGIIESGTDIISTPRNIVKKLSTAFTSKNSSGFVPKFSSGNMRKPLLEPICPYIPTRRSLFRRIAHLNEEIGNREHQVNGTKHIIGKQAIDADRQVMDYHWEAIERILFIYAKLNPGVGYVQGMNEILAPIYYVFTAKAAEDDPESQAYAEADTFFVFTTLMSDTRDHFVRSLDQDASTGINATMWRMSQRLAWFDRPLFRHLSMKDIKEQYYAFRWITVLCSQEWDLPDVIRLWDSVLADRGMQEGLEEGRFEFLLDFAVAMLICIRQELIEGDFADNMRILQNYPIDDMQVVMNSAYSIREARLQAIASGKIIPGVNDRRSNGMINMDYSDTSSISSTGSGSRLRKLRDTTDMARASLDSLRKGSKESLDELFKRGLYIARNTSEELDRKRASTGDMTRSLSQRLGFSNSLASKMKRTSSLRSSHSEQKDIEEQIHQDWLLANQLHATENNQYYHTQPNTRTSSLPSNSNQPRTNSLINRFSQFVSSKPVAPYKHHSLPQNEQDNTTKKAISPYPQSPVLSNPLQNKQDREQLANNLNVRRTVVGAYDRGYV